MYKSFCRLDLDATNSDWIDEDDEEDDTEDEEEEEESAAEDNVNVVAISGKAIDDDGVDVELVLIIEFDPNAIGFDNDVINR